MESISRSLKALELATVLLFLLALASLLWPPQVTTQLPDSQAVPVRQAVTGWWDVLRLYVFPAMGTLLMGAVAILLDWIRRAMIRSTAETAKASAHAEVAATKAVQVSEMLKAEAEKHWGSLEQIRNIAEGTYNLVTKLEKRAENGEPR